MDKLLDKENINKTIGSDPNLIKKIITLYLRDAPKLLNEIDEAVKSGDNKKMSENAHALKGITGYYNNGDVYNICLKLEQSGKTDCMPEKNEEIADSLSQLKDFISRLIEELKVYIEQI